MNEDALKSQIDIGHLVADDPFTQKMFQFFPQDEIHSFVTKIIHGYKENCQSTEFKGFQTRKVIKKKWKQARQIFKR